jgi:surface protein
MLKLGNTYLNFGGTYLSGWVDPYNPLNLPSNTVRVRTSDGKIPQKRGSDTTYETAILVPGTNDVYDVYKSGTSFVWLFQQSENIVEVLGANTTGITDMSGMFKNCYNLTTVPLFNTSSVTSMASMFSSCRSLTSIPLLDTSNVTLTSSMFYYCTSLTNIPLLNTSKVTRMVDMFYYCTSLTNIPLLDTSKVTDMTDICNNCINVESGALALYQQASNQTTPPSEYNRAFRDCGINTQTGSAELAQIPSDWK